MVRLKASRKLEVQTGQDMFQFHYGTIKRRYRPLKIMLPENRFNSIMVRLKVDKKITFTSIKKVSIPLWYD